LNVYEAACGDAFYTTVVDILERNITQADALSVDWPKADVIVGNPPYQMCDGGYGRSASPLYHKFIQRAKNADPCYITMIVPSRWFGGGKGLTDFRREMLNDARICQLVDFEDSSDVFPDVSIAGGVCYFMWDAGYNGPCGVTNMRDGIRCRSIRPLNEFESFVRDSRAIPIIHKVLARGERSMQEQVSGYKPFGLRTYIKPQELGDITLYWRGGEGPYRREDIHAGVEMIDKWKVVASRSAHEHAGKPDKDGTRRVLSRTAVLPPGTVCTETYLVIGSYETEQEARNLLVYMKTRLFRFLMSLLMYSHGITRNTFELVPQLEMWRAWSDTVLYARYGLTFDEIEFIESKIRSMV
jgi:site-specific DNA-methyltransferase (adenine-specific)